MSATPYLLVFDHGTTGVRAGLLDAHGHCIAQDYQAIPQIYPKPGWVEHDPAVLWQLTQSVAEGALQTGGIGWEQIAAIGLTNQRETILLWDRDTGRPIYNAIVWQCRRTANRCEALKNEGLASMIQAKTGLVIDPYFSATKIEWLFQEIPEAKILQTQGRLLAGTVDTWILWNLSGGKLHVTDFTNASRTMLLNIHQRTWDEELLGLFGIPQEILPHVQAPGWPFGVSQAMLTGGREIPIAVSVGDQQAALFGQRCWQPGEAKSTYGTGAFIMMNLGEHPVVSEKGILTTLAYDKHCQPCYALEGSIFTAGATLEWLQNQLGLFQNGKEAGELAASTEDNGGVYLAPAFAGLGAPHWDSEARGLITGLSLGTGKAQLARAAFEAMAYQTREVLDLMQQEAGLSLQGLRIDGGVSRSDFLSQFLADILNIQILRSDEPDLTVRGAAYLTGLIVGFWSSPEAILKLPEKTRVFEPGMPTPLRERYYQEWQTAAHKALTS